MYYIKNQGRGLTRDEQFPKLLKMCYKKKSRQRPNERGAIPKLLKCVTKRI
jgi:hypothetical protein